MNIYTTMKPLFHLQTTVLDAYHKVSLAVTTPNIDYKMFS